MRTNLYKVKESVEVDITEKELGRLLFQHLSEKLGYIDDAGCDWFTQWNKTYIGGLDWKVSDDVIISMLVDAANILLNGKVMQFPDFVE